MAHCVKQEEEEEEKGLEEGGRREVGGEGLEGGGGKGYMRKSKGAKGTINSGIFPVVVKLARGRRRKKGYFYPTNNFPFPFPPTPHLFPFL